MKITIETETRKITVETDFNHCDFGKNRELLDKMYADCIRYIFTGEKQKGETDGTKH